MGFLSRLFGGKNRRGIRGTPIDWQVIGAITPCAGTVCLGDANLFPDYLREFPLANSLHTVQVRRLDFDGDVRICALRLFSGQPFILGEAVGEVSSDCASVCVTALPCPLTEFQDVFLKHPPLDREMEFHCDDDAGAATLSSQPPVDVIYCSTGFGDGSFSVHRLLLAGTPAGYQITFIRDDDPYPF